MNSVSELLRLLVKKNAEAKYASSSPEAKRNNVKRLLFNKTIIEILAARGYNYSDIINYGYKL